MATKFTRSQPIGFFLLEWSREANWSKIIYKQPLANDGNDGYIYLLYIEINKFLHLHILFLHGIILIMIIYQEQYLFIHLPQQNFANEGHFLACIEYPYKSWNDSHVSVNIDDDDVGLISKALMIIWIIICLKIIQISYL